MPTFISLSAENLDESVAFYTSVFGMERLTAEDGNVTEAWLALGNQQVHLVLRDALTPRVHSFELAVEDFDAVHRRLAEGDWFFATQQLPDGSVELDVRDPDGHIVEVDWPDLATLDPSVALDIRRRSLPPATTDRPPGPALADH
jgi:catechol 2,3-dioxygenase-like lactoylglutathione lyase family enzyme